MGRTRHAKQFRCKICKSPVAYGRMTCGRLPDGSNSDCLNEYLSRRGRNRIAYQPTPETIKSACMKMKDGWNRSQEMGHRGIVADIEESEAVVIGGANIPTVGSFWDA